MKYAVNLVSLLTPRSQGDRVCRTDRGVLVPTGTHREAMVRFTVMPILEVGRRIRSHDPNRGNSEMALNQDLTFGDLEAYVRDAFQTKFAPPTKDRLPAGMVLDKFNDFNTLHGPTNNALSGWWSPYEPYKHDPGWVQRRK